jgi:hypothetical protein
MTIVSKIQQYKAQMRELEAQYQRLVGAVAALEDLAAASGVSLPVPQGEEAPQ